VTKLCKLGAERLDPHIRPMPHKESSPRTLDLFDFTPTASRPLSKLTSSCAEPPGWADLSDAGLAKLLGELLCELQRRMEPGGRDSRSELERAVRDASISLEGLVPRDRKPVRGQRTMKRSPSLQEGQRKAVRAALLAGVAPSQVAKHFGLSLASVRKVLTDAA
jgi:hypothetical protein